MRVTFFCHASHVPFLCYFSQFRRIFETVLIKSTKPDVCISTSNFPNSNCHASHSYYFADITQKILKIETIIMATGKLGTCSFSMNINIYPRVSYNLQIIWNKVKINFKCHASHRGIDHMVCSWKFPETALTTIYWFRKSYRSIDFSQGG